MTEERIKELLVPIIAELWKWALMVKKPNHRTVEGLVSSLVKPALYTVATESQKEGIDEMEHAIHGFCAADITKRIAERLKKQEVNREDGNAGYDDCYYLDCSTWEPDGIQHGYGAKRCY